MAESNKKVIDLNPEKIEVTLPIGASGTQFFKGMFNITDDLEYVNDLRGSKAIRTYNRMRKSDGQVKSILLALTHPIVDATWTIQEPTDATPKEKEATKLLNDWFFGSDFGWEGTLRQICSFFWAGFSVHEKIYAYDGKYIRLEKLSQRLPHTIVEWDIDPAKEKLRRVRQQIDAGETTRDVWIPAEKLIVFSFDQEGDDFRGQSPLRAAYKHFYYKEAFERLWAIQLERWGIGIPKVKQTGSVIGGPSKDKAIQAAKKLGAHEEAYIWEPFGLEISILDAGTGKMVDIKPAIDFHNLEMARCILAQFIMMGQTETGARSVGETLKDMYLKGLAFSANYISELITNNVLKELCKWNWGDIRVPKLVCDGIQPMELELFSSAYSNLASSGVLTMDDSTEDYIRKQVGLPVMDKATSRSRLPAESNTGIENQNENNQQMKDGKHKHTVKAYDAGSKLAVPNDMPVGTYIQFWRPLRDSEKYVALREIIGHMDDAREKIVDQTSQARKEVVNELMKQIVDAANSKDPDSLQKIDYSDTVADKLAKSMIGVLENVVDYGRMQVSRELDSQKGRLSLSFPGSKKDAAAIMQKYLKSKAQHSTEISLDKIVDEARVQAGVAMRTGTVDPARIRQELESFSEKTVRRSANFTVALALSFGRQQEAEIRKDEVLKVEYSAIMDGNTCAPCSQLDGQEFDMDSPEYDRYAPPLYDCQGGDQCRCLWIYILKPERGE